MQEIMCFLCSQTGHDLNQFLRCAIRDPELVTCLDNGVLECRAASVQEPAVSADTPRITPDRRRLRVYRHPPR